jgi:hypothetical protein
LFLFCLQTTNTTSLAALEKLKADLEAKRQGKGTPPPLSPKLASSAPALPSAGSLLSPRSRVPCLVVMVLSFFVP